MYNKKEEIMDIFPPPGTIVTWRPTDQTAADVKIIECPLTDTRESDEAGCEMPNAQVWPQPHIDPYCKVQVLPNGPERFVWLAELEEKAQPTNVGGVVDGSARR